MRVLFLSLFPALLLVSCRPAGLAPVAVEPPQVNLPASIQRLTPEQMTALRQSTPELIIIDLRDHWEIQENGRLPGTTHFIDYLNTTAFSELIAKLDHSKPYLLCCAIGGRAKLAAAEMSAKGFTHLAMMEGGFDAWLRSGQTLQK